jgi:hypothetical protein
MGAVIARSQYLRPRKSRRRPLPAQAHGNLRATSGYVLIYDSWRNRPGRPRIGTPMARPNNINKTAEEYRQLAENCRELARTVSTVNGQADLLERAQIWDLIADRGERALALDRDRPRCGG